MTKVKKILAHKGRDVWNISPDDTVYNAIKLMEDKEIGALAVLYAGTMIGIISERDYARKVILKNRSSKDTKVKEIMTRQVYYTQPEQDIEECLAVMTNRRVRHLPVIQNGKIAGMISIGDVVKEIISEQRFMIEQLEHTLAWEEAY
ncbi:CBS domain-containing protein [Kaarinaea lacus]